ncbi:MAG: hypothetical protein OHK0031_07040 [Anaerolineales bacterium]
MKKLSPFLPFLLLAWFTAAQIGYVAGHKPFSAEELFVWLQAAGQALTALAILTLAGGLGERILPAAPPSAMRAALTAGLGLGLLGLTTFGVGIFLGAGAIFSLSILLAAALLAGRKSLLWLRNFQAPNPLLPLPPFLRLLAILLLLPPFLTALAPPLAFDALVYHLTLPQLAAQSGHIAYTPDVMFAGMPQLSESLYLLALSLTGTPAAVFLGFLLGLLGIFALSAFTAERLSPRAGQGALMALLAGETLVSELAWGYVDWNAFFFGALLFISLAEWQTTRAPRWLGLAGVFGGLALSVKYTAGVILPGALLFLALQRGFSWREKMLNMLRLSLPAALVLSPWLLRNLAWTGNPLYPLLFPAGAMSAPRLMAFQGAPPWRGWADVLILPWQATMLGIEDKEGFSASIGPLLLIFSAAAFLPKAPAENGAAKARAEISLAACLTLTGMFIWLIGSRLSLLLIQTRLYFAFFPVWAFLAGAGFDALTQINLPGLRLGKIFQALAFVPLIFAAMFGLKDFSARGAAGYWLGNLSGEEYRVRNLGALPAALESVRALPAGSRVLFLWETRGLGCLPICDPDETIDNWYAARHTFGSAENILRAWHNSGYTHVLVFKNGVDFVRAEHDSRLNAADWQEFDRLLAKLRPAKDLGGVYTLYEIPR